MSVLVLGTVALDTVKTPFGRRINMLGGSAVHFSMSCRLFTDVHLSAVIGEDFPPWYLEFLHNKGLILTSLLRKKGKTFKWEGEYRQDFNTAVTLKTELGVLSEFLPEITRQEKKIKNVFLANVDPDIQNHLLGILSNPRLVALDSMNFWINHKKASLLRVLKKVDIYVANEQEAKSLTGENNLLKAARCLRAKGPKMVLIKKGEHGVLFYCDKFIFSLPAYPTEKVIDPTGAGDTFAGGFMGYLAKAKNLSAATIKKAITYGTVAASFNVEDFGADKTAGLTLDILESRLGRFKKIVLF